MDATCPFCVKLKQLDTLPPGEVVWQFPGSVALLGTWQFYQGYCVLVSRRHATELSQLDETERRGYLDEMCLLARAIEAAFQPHKLNYELLGNQVPHLHWHVFPRSADDPRRLDPVWLDIDAANNDPVLRHQLTGTRERLAVAEHLGRLLTTIGAPQA